MKLRFESYAIPGVAWEATSSGWIACPTLYWVHRLVISGSDDGSESAPWSRSTATEQPAPANDEADMLGGTFPKPNQVALSAGRSPP